MEINLLLLENIEKVLGPSSRKAGSNYAFHCPFCNHHKKKLEVQVYTNDKGENPWACWVCNTRGKTVRSLLRQLKVSPESQKQVLQHISKGESLDSKVDIGLTLPKEFISLKNASTTSVELNRVRKYLAARGIFNEEIIKYAKEDILEIEDISEFVSEQYQFVLHNELDKLIIPEEKPYLARNNEVNKFLKIS